MKSLLAAITLSLATATGALAFDAATQSIIDSHKAGKPIVITDVAHLMAASARWCYGEDDQSCAWSDVYLKVDKSGATFEISNAWDSDRDIAFTESGRFADNRYICETGENWVPSVRATMRGNGSVIAGRDLWALKQEIDQIREGGADYCFDYLYLSAQPDRQTVTLLQRQYDQGAHLDGSDIEVTVHFDEDQANALTLRW